MPATEDDLENADGIIKEPSYYYTQRKPKGGELGTSKKGEEAKNEGEGPGSSADLIRRPTTKFSHVAIVQYAEQVQVEVDGVQQLVIKTGPIPITEPVHLMKQDDFARTIIKSKVGALSHQTQEFRIVIIKLTLRIYSRNVFVVSRSHNRDLLPLPWLSLP
jgi:hypothetical protein